MDLGSVELEVRNSQSEGLQARAGVWGGEPRFGVRDLFFVMVPGRLGDLEFEGVSRQGYISRGHFTRKPVRTSVNTGDFDHLTRKVTRKEA